MARMDMIILEEDHLRFMTALEELRRDTNAKFVFLLDKNGQQIASSGAVDGVDPTSLASLTAGSVAATEGLASLIYEPEFTALYHEGRKDSLFISQISQTVIQLVIFDERSSIGLVRLRVEQQRPKIAAITEEMSERQETQIASAQQPAALAEISDADIDALFG